MHPGHGLHRQAGIGTPFEHVLGDVRLGAGGGIEHRDRFQIDPRLGDEVAQQQIASRFGLAGHEPDPGEIRGARESPGVAARHHQPLGTPRPFDHHHRLARELARNETLVELSGLRVEYVHARRERLARHHSRESVDAAAEERRDLGAGFANRPFEQRVVAPRKHRRRRGEIDRTVGELHPAAHPGFDEITREQHLPRHPAHRDLLLRDELVYLAFLDPEEIGNFPGGEERVHDSRRSPGPCGGGRRRGASCAESIIGRS